MLGFLTDNLISNPLTVIMQLEGIISGLVLYWACIKCNEHLMTNVVADENKKTDK